MNVNLDLLLFKENVVVSDLFTKNKLSESNKIKGAYLNKDKYPFLMLK